jgi:diadenosine tetraphosphatase ApaH/serine/threonine PP2A family protein phosphatase
MAETLALLSDVHSNLEALEACLAHARMSGATRFALLGDLVGYGADPVAVVDIAMSLAAGGATIVKGNHDEAVERPQGDLNQTARIAIEWTRGVLDAPRRAFLASLPLCVRVDGHCFVHASADRPERWTYVDGPGAARLCMNAAGTPYAFCGHVHEQRLYFEQGGRVSLFRPTAGVAVPVPCHRRWLALPGSVGQPRDGRPAAAYALLEPGRQIAFHRVPYDHDRAARKIRAAGLPESLAWRVQRGA